MECSRVYGRNFAQECFTRFNSEIRFLSIVEFIEEKQIPVCSFDTHLWIAEIVYVCALCERLDFERGGADNALQEADIEKHVELDKHHVALAGHLGGADLLA